MSTDFIHVFYKERVTEKKEIHLAFSSTSYVGSKLINVHIFPSQKPMRQGLFLFTSKLSKLGIFS